MASEKLRKFGMMASSAAISLSKPNYFESNNTKGAESILLSYRRGIRVKNGFE